MYFHTPGYIRTNRQVIYMDIYLKEKLTIDAEHEILNLLPRKHHFECNDTKLHNKDLCTEVSLKEVKYIRPSLLTKKSSEFRERHIYLTYGWAKATPKK